MDTLTVEVPACLGGKQLMGSSPYLSVQSLSLGGHTLVVLVMVAGAQPADEHLALAAVELLQVLVLGADLLGQVAGGRDELVGFEGLLGLVGPQVGVAEGAHTHQAALHRRTLLSFAHVARHDCAGQGDSGSLCPPTGAPNRVSYLRFEGPLTELLHRLSQHGIPRQGGLGAEGLAALGAAVDSFGFILGPEVLDAGHAVAVPTGDGDRIVWKVETHGAVKLLLRPQLGTHDDVGHNLK